MFGWENPRARKKTKLLAIGNTVVANQTSVFHSLGSPDYVLLTSKERGGRDRKVNPSRGGH